MSAYGPSHVAVLVVIAVLALVLVPLVRRAERERAEQVLEVVGWVLLINSVFWTLWGLMPWSWNLQESVPLHLSDVYRVIGALALITRSRWAVAVCYYWGLTLNAMSVFTPDLNYFVHPGLEFAEYWTAHGIGMLIPVVLTWGLGYRPGWHGFRLTYLVTCVWAAVALAFNALAGTNYGYLSRPPVGPSLLDVLGPWPMSILAEALLAALVWALMTWPWERRERHRRSEALSRTEEPIRSTGVPADGSMVQERPSSSSSASATRAPD
jgi:hypothetical integral membrane protein (TIGR02206 family)